MAFFWWTLAIFLRTQQRPGWRTTTLLAVERSDGGPARSQIRSRRRSWHRHKLA
jgi:hypothetical protein